MESKRIGSCKHGNNLATCEKCSMEIKMGVKAAIEARVAKEAAKADWRTATCGECGWAVMHRLDAEFKTFICRNVAWQNSETGAYFPNATPACPAFVAREGEKNNRPPRSQKPLRG